ncbi:hypothetical protein ACE6H2_008312 [Prunus campanulata]
MDFAFAGQETCENHNTHIISLSDIMSLSLSLHIQNIYHPISISLYYIFTSTQIFCVCFTYIQIGRCCHGMQVQIQLMYDLALSSLSVET